MLVTLIPFFDKDMKVSAYSLFSQKENYLLNPDLQGIAILNGSGRIDGLEVIENIGLDTLTPNTDVFLPIGPINIFSDIEAQVDAKMRRRLVLLFDNSIENTVDYQKRLKELKESGFKMAIYKIPIAEFEQKKEILRMMTYIILDCNVTNQEIFDRLKDDEMFPIFEGEFYRIPVTKGDTKIEPLKVNYLELMNIVNDDDYELTKAADIIGRDTALVVSLLDMVNRIAINSKITSIRHAAAILGQKELKKWINTVITKELCADKPNEITRISLLRAKFVESLAPAFEMAIHASELFLMGLFSVLDIILDVPMAEALEKVNVSKNIRNAILDRKGPFAEVYEFMIAYENADWQEVCRWLIVKDIDVDTIYKAYTETMVWYKEMFFER